MAGRATLPDRLETVPSCEHREHRLSQRISEEKILLIFVTQGSSAGCHITGQTGWRLKVEQRGERCCGASPEICHSRPDLCESPLAAHFLPSHT